MSNGTTGWITVLLRLPVFYNPDTAGYRASVEDDKFLETADALARRFGGGTLFIFRTTLHEGSGGIKALSKETCWH